MGGCGAAPQPPKFPDYSSVGYNPSIVCARTGSDVRDYIGRALKDNFKRDILRSADQRQRLDYAHLQGYPLQQGQVSLPYPSAYLLLGRQFEENRESRLFFAMDANEGILYSGMHMFSKKLLETYRQAVLDPTLGKELEAALDAVRGAGKYEIGGDTYKRVPCGYPAEHARARYLLHTGLHATSPKIEAKTLTSPALVDVCYEYALHMAPIHRWLVQIISLPSV